MNPIDHRLVGLIEIAETPLYSAYRWLERDLGGVELSLPGFLRSVDGLIERDVLRLWHVDLDSHERERRGALPSDLGESYAAIPDLDGSYDPFGFSLTPGAPAKADEEPDWEYDVDFAAREYVIRARPEAVTEARERLSGLYAAASFSEVKCINDGSRVRIEGTVTGGEVRE